MRRRAQPLAEVRRLPLAPALRPPKLTFFPHRAQVRIRRLRAPLPPDPVLADARHPHADGQALLLAVEPPAPLQVRPRSLPLFLSALVPDARARLQVLLVRLHDVLRASPSLFRLTLPSRTRLTLLLSPAHAVRHLGRFPHVGRRLHPLRPVHSESRQRLHAIVEGHRASERSLSFRPSQVELELTSSSAPPSFPQPLFYISPSHSPTRLDSLDMTATSERRRRCRPQVALFVVFGCASALAFAILRYRSGQCGLHTAVWEQAKWTVRLTVADPTLRARPRRPLPPWFLALTLPLSTAQPFNTLFFMGLSLHVL